MSPIRNACLVLKEYVDRGYPESGKTYAFDDSQTIDLDTVQLGGGVLVKIMALSIDPYMNRRMLTPSQVASKESITPYELGAPLRNAGVAVILRSENTAFTPGDHLVTNLPFQEYTVIHDISRASKLENKEKIPLSAYLGVCGMPGQTAHHGWEEFAEAKKGEVAFVSAASGGVGSIVVQLAKSAGLKVIASAGSDEKVAYVSSLGADVAFNYKTTSTNKVLEKEGPINIFWDNVGGETLEAAIQHSAPHARFIICGSIANYNTSTPYNVKNLQLIVWRELRLSGFLVASLAPRHAEDFFRAFPARVASGEIRYLEHVTHGLESAGSAIVDVLKGANIGKSVVVLADD